MSNFKTDYTQTFDEMWPERAAERDAKLAARAAARARPATEHSDAAVFEALQIAAEYRSRGQTIVKAIESLCRYNPAAAIPYFEQALAKAPGIDPSHGK